MNRLSKTTNPVEVKFTPDPEPASEYQRFVDLAKRIVSVPKADTKEKAKG